MEGYAASSPEHDPTELDTYEIGGRSLRQWFDWLTTDRDTGQYAGYLDVPCSRFGTTAADCAWWTLAFQCAYVEASGELDDPEASMHEAMGWCVNDSTEVAGLIAEYWSAIPQSIKDHIGDEDDVRRRDG